MRVIMLKLVLSEKVTDDLMLAVTSPCHRNQVVWQRPISTPPSSLLASSFSCVFFFPSFPGPSSPTQNIQIPLCWTSNWPMWTDLAQRVQLSTHHVDWCGDPGEKIKIKSNNTFQFGRFSTRNALKFVVSLLCKKAAILYELLILFYYMYLS